MNLIKLIISVLKNQMLLVHLQMLVNVELLAQLPAHSLCLMGTQYVSVATMLMQVKVELQTQLLMKLGTFIKLIVLEN